MTSTGIAERPTVPMRPLSPGTAPRPGGWAARVVLGLLLGAAGTVVVAGSWLLLVADSHGRRVDHALMLAVQDRFTSVQGGILDLLRLVNVASVGLVLLVIAGIALARRRPGAALAGVALVLATQMVTQGLKAVLPREGAAENSLPSGHVTVITALSWRPCWRCPRRCASWWARRCGGRGGSRGRRHGGRLASAR